MNNAFVLTFIIVQNFAIVRARSSCKIGLFIYPLMPKPSADFSFALSLNPRVDQNRDIIANLGYFEKSLETA
jgi:hypothetical protein